MYTTEPGVHLIAATEVHHEALAEYLTTIGADGWESDEGDGIYQIIEVMSRSCYKSFGKELNANLTRVRGSNEEHLKNIIRVNHGSVLEHGWVSFMFTNVSRVFTHELVRHRVGTAISQESLRYVRLDDLGMWIPSCYRDNPEAVKVFETVWELAEEAYKSLLSEEVLGFDIDKANFDIKKEHTSAARRVAPIGLATNIGWSCNIRELRHVIQMRTAPEAEEEIRVVFKDVLQIAYDMWPTLFGDL